MRSDAACGCKQGDKGETPDYFAVCSAHFDCGIGSCESRNELQLWIARGASAGRWAPHARLGCAPQRRRTKKRQNRAKTYQIKANRAKKTKDLGGSAPWYSVPCSSARNSPTCEHATQGLGVWHRWLCSIVCVRASQAPVRCHQQRLAAKQVRAARRTACQICPWQCRVNAVHSPAAPASQSGPP